VPAGRQGSGKATNSNLPRTRCGFLFLDILFSVITLRWFFKTQLSE